MGYIAKGIMSEIEFTILTSGVGAFAVVSVIIFAIAYSRGW